MRDQLDRLFDRFRRRGDVQALGEVFDETAPELLRVAASLVRDANEADDLLQQTFLTAIERAGRYESSRRLVPWLLGILVHHAREERRRRARPLEAARLERPEPARPEARVFESEVGLELERALAGLSSDDRSVLEDYLRADKSPAEIARERGLAPGAARMRIHRGLDRLRKALPAGLVAGAAEAASAQGLGAVRTAVLRAGAAAARELAAGAAGVAAGATGGVAGASTAGLLGGLMGKKLILAGIAAALVAGMWLLVQGTARPGGEEREVAHAESSARARPEGSEVAAPLRDIPALSDLPSNGQARRSALTPAADPLLSGLRGRVLEHDGQPLWGAT